MAHAPLHNRVKLALAKKPEQVYKGKFSDESDRHAEEYDKLNDALGGMMHVLYDEIEAKGSTNVGDDLHELLDRAWQVNSWDRFNRWRSMFKKWAVTAGDTEGPTVSTSTG